MRFDRVSNIFEIISEDLAKQGYFFSKGDGSPNLTQKSVVRTNCMDCLDRTNVTQAALARRTLLLQLVNLGIFDPKTTLEENKPFDSMLKNGEKKIISLLLRIF